MISGSGHPLAYPVLTTCGALVICLAWAPFADSEQLAMLGAVALVVLVYSGFRVLVASGVLPWHTDPRISSAPDDSASADTRSADTEAADSGATESGVTGSGAAESGVAGSGVSGRNALRCRRIRQQHRLLSRSWLELTADDRTCWLPVYFDPTLVTAADSTAELTDGVVRFGNVRLYPSGPVRDREPVGRLHDNPTRPDPDGPAHAAAASRFTRRLLLDGQFAVAAPFAALLWVYIAGGGFPAFAGAFTVAAGVAVWFSAIRGSDPS
ncbi:hypothetical protein [Nocardia macrotermitis]|uniref:Uncharacterized protein n=1 Tax=Nocardia macrotermitis TaxID=2585198 RepID=A0A7K0D9C4_9NOCA|nr:hypothetical protein [Nocardia macrotermitis]MQY22376.1 hypothetical protein [Nocardia macrotermitis]